MAVEFKNGLIVNSTGTVLDVQGSQGQLFSITDNLTGDLFSVADISGVPILNVNSSGAITLDGYLPDNTKLNLGDSNDLQIYHDGSHSYIRDTGGGNLIITGSQLTFSNVLDTEYMVKMVQDGAVDLYYNGSKKLETTNTGVTITGGWVTTAVSVAQANVEHTDNTKSMFGNGNDLQIFHDGSNSYIKDNGTGRLRLQASSQIDFLAANGESMANMIENGAVKLYHNNVQKLETVAVGVEITGELQADTLDIDGNADISGNLTGVDTLTVQYGRFTSTGDASVSSTGHAFQTGATSSTNIIIDNNEIMARNNGATSALNLNPDGNTVTFHSNGNSSQITDAGNATFAGDVTVSGGDITLGGTGRIQGVDTVTASTDAANKTYVDTAISNLVDSAPGTLNTLNELADALGDDADFSTTVTNSIATKLPLAGGTMTGDIILNDNVEVEFGTGSDVKMKFDGSDLVTTVPTGSAFMIGTNGGTPDDNGGKADFVVDVNSSPQIALYNNQVQVGGTDMNWNSKLLYDGSTKFAAWDNDIQIFTQGSGSNTAKTIHIRPQAAGGTTTTVAQFNGDTGTTLTGNLDLNGNADISGNLTGLDNVTSTNFIIGGHTINDVDLNGEFVDSSEHLLTSAGAHDRFLRKTTHGQIGGSNVTFGSTTSWANNPEPGFYHTNYSGSSGLVFMTGDVGGSASSIGLEFNYQGSIKVHSNTDSNTWHTHSVWTENDFSKSSVLNSNVTLSSLGAQAAGNYLTSLSGAVLTTGNQSVAGVKSFSGKIGADAGIDGLTNANGGITGSNYNISGVNQLTINDPGEGIVFNGTTNVSLFTVDDSTDSILRITNASALDVNCKITDVTDPTSAQDAATKAYVDGAVYTHPTTAGNKHIPTGGASGQFLKYTSSGTAVWATPSYTTNTDTNKFLSGISKSSNTLTFAVTNGTDQTYTFGANAFNSTTIPAAESYTQHENISAATSVNGTGRAYIQDITVDSNGHVTGIATASESNQTSVTGSSGSCTGNAATATLATAATTVTVTANSQDGSFYPTFVDATSGNENLRVDSAWSFNPSSNTMSVDRVTTATSVIRENNSNRTEGGVTGLPLMTLTGQGAGNASNISLHLAGDSVSSNVVKMRMTALNGDSNLVGAGHLSYSATSDNFGIGQSTSHNQMAILIDNSDVVSMKNQTTFTNGIDVTSAVNSTSKTTGTVKIAGGVGIVKTLNVGQDVVAYASSDERYKDNLKPITNPIDKVKSLTGYTFTWNDKHEQFNGNNDIGVVAQEVEKVLPEIVDTRDDGYKAVKYEKMVALLIEAVKDQQTQIDDLKTIIDGYSK